ncbi:MAG: PAS domain S-box protein [Balneolaceae bacterium]|nr:PAS domain S-box protein [Balneolaceae bacterium]MBO6546405.1 PAS domain S-box protein [Balneolaceae bacterium]MBO6648764.1 PAS domain S-box protein [Balneolaceae bacterium]
MLKSEETFFGSQLMFICDQISLRILDINENVVRRFGLSREEIIGKRLDDFGTRITSHHPKISNAQTVSNQVWEFEIADKEHQLVQFSSHLINYKGRPSKLVVAHDIAQTLFNVNSEYQLSSPVEFIDFPMGEIEWNSEHKVLRWSPKAEELFGWTQDEAIKHPDMLNKFVHPEDIELVKEEFKETVKHRIKSKSILNRNITKSGDTIYCEWYNSYLFDDAGRLVSTYSLVLDITQRIEAMNRSHRSMQSYRDLFDSISDAIYLVNDEGIILGANMGTKYTFGYSVQELVGEHYKKLSAPGKFLPDRLMEIKKADQNSSVKLDGWGRKSNGEVFPTELLVNTGTYFDEEVLIIIERDISERKLAEEELKKRQHLLSDLFNTSPLGIALLNSHNEVIEVNKGFERLFGYEEMEIAGLELDRVIVPDTEIDYARRLTETPYVEEVATRRKTKSGELIDVIIYAVPIIIDEKMMYKYGIYVDITDRKKAEEKVRDSLKEKEVLLAEIHHRVKNNLAVITGLLELQSYTANDENARKILRDSQMRIHSIALVHEKLYDNENFSEIKVQDYIKELSKTIEQTMGTGSITVEMTFDLDDIILPITQAIPCGLLLNEVLTNSFKHAFKGREKGNVVISFSQQDGHHLFRIKDDGVGIDKDLPPKKGSSLGMKLIKTLTKQLNAEMEVSNEEGAVFEFRF